MKLSVWLAAAAACAYLCRDCLGVAQATVAADLQINDEQMGWIMGLFFWSYALGQIPGGWLGNLFGSRLCLPAFSALSSATMLLWGMATGTVSLILGRLGIGVAQAGLFPCSVIAISRWFPQTERASVSGILGAAMKVGALIAAPLTAVLLQWISWRVVFALYAIPGLIWSVGFWFWFRERPEEHPSVNSGELWRIRAETHRRKTTDPHSASRTPWLRLATSRVMWMICGQQFFRAAAYVWFSTWFPRFLRETRNVSQLESGWLTAIPILASMIGGILSGGVSDWVLRSTGSLSRARCGVAAVSLATCGVLVFAAFFIRDATLATLVIGTGAFFAACAGPCAYAATMDVGGHHVAAVFSTMNMIGNFGAGLFPILVPLFVGWVNANESVLSLSGGNSWNAVLMLFAATYAAAAVCWLTIRLDGPLFDDPSDTGELAT